MNSFFNWSLVKKVEKIFPKRKKSKKEVEKTKKALLFTSLGIVGGLVILLLLILAIYSVSYQKKNYLNQYMGPYKFGGFTKEQTVSLLKTESAKFLSEKLILKNTDTGKVYEVNPVEIGANYDIDRTADNIWSYGRNKGALGNFFDQIKSLFVHKQYFIVSSYNTSGLNQKIKTIADELDKPEKDYDISYQEGKFVLLSERKPGMRIDQEKLVDEVYRRLTILSGENITFSLINFEPKVSEESAKKAVEEANAIITGDELIMTGQGQQYSIDKDTIAGFIGTSAVGQRLEIKFDEDRIKKHLETIAKTIDMEPVNAKLKMENGRVNVFDAARNGKKLKVPETISEIEGALLARINGNNNQVALKIEIKKPQITETEISSLGIKELIGSASTSFKGSPVNRVHNITVGMNGINGVLLKPGETFSTLGHLGSISAEGGYLPELVIRDDSTVPEFGGGLCQVSSTLFRMALNAGMKITERANHKYRVGYFEPPIGMDATIYDPAPDFKFINNYSSYVLIQSRIQDKNLIFEVYGTKDGRKIEISDPVGYDYTSPGDPVMIETDTLPAGEKKQLEKAHNGASAKFDYKITSAGGEMLQQKTFTSKYVPWPEKWLVGKGQAAAVPGPNCTDGAQNGDETGTDCGGSCPNVCQ